MRRIQELLSQGEAREALTEFIRVWEEQPHEQAARAAEMSRVLLEAVEGFELKPSIEFCRLLNELHPGPLAEEITSAVRPLFERTQYWVRELDGVTRERLAREARAAVTVNELKTAAQRGATLLKRARNDAETGAYARYLIEALGGLVRDAERSRQVIMALIQGGVIPSLSYDWREIFQKAMDRTKSAGFQESDREWTQVFTSACVSIREFMPAKREADEPTEEQMKRFTSEVRSVFRAGLLSAREDDLLDAIGVIKEFSPTDPSHIPSPVGVEPRLFLELGPRAKLTAVRGLALVGEIPRLREKIVALANSPTGEGRIEFLAPIMGGLRHNDFYPYLSRVFGAMNTPKRQELVADALSRIANPEAMDLILAELARCMKKQIDPTEGRRAKMLLTALGRIARGRGIHPADRNRIVEQTIRLVGERDADLSCFAALQMFTLRLEELDRASRAWGARQITRALFGPDVGQDLKTAQTEPLGFRQPMAAGLMRLGKEFLDEMLEVGLPAASSFSGAFPAFGDVLEKIGDERAIPILETMIRTTFLNPDEPKATYLLNEKLKDAASGEMRKLDPDHVLHTLLHALEKTGGERGKRILLSIADQVQSGQLMTPGSLSSSILLDAKRKSGTLGQREKSLEEPGEAVSNSEFEKALSLAKGGVFSTKQKQVEGLALLGRARRPESLPVILSCLQSGDALVFRSAETALTQFVSPLPSPKEFEQFLDELFSVPKLLKGEGLERLIQVMIRSFPKRAPYDAVFAKRVGAQIEDGVLRFKLEAAMRLKEAVAAKPPGEPGDAIPGGAEPEPGPAKITELERKREYMLRRQAWIRAGKRGPPPDPPA